MLTPDYLDGLPEKIIQIFQNLEDFMIGDIARRIKKVGNVTATANIQRIALQEMGESTKAINIRIAEAIGATEKEVKQIFAQSEQILTDEQAQVFEAVGIKQNTGFAKQVGEAAVKSAMGDLNNLTRTMGYPTKNGQFTLWTDAYRQALGFAQMQVATGAIDYNTAIRQAIKPFTSMGLRSVSYQSGRTLSIEAAARQCIIGGVSDMVKEISRKNAEDIGTDGWEISAHADCAPDHEGIQGRQFSNVEYDNLNNNLERQIGSLGCRHMAFPILMGISERAHSDLELEEMSKKNEEGIMYEGKHYTRYEASQMQRQIERSIRKTKCELIGADKAGLKDDFTAKSIKLRRQRDYYNDFSAKAGLLKQNERAQVSGYGRSMSGKVLSAEKKAIEKSGESGIIKTIDSGKQGKHILGHNNYVKGRSYLTATGEQAQNIVNKYSGTGERIGKNKEKITADKMVGVNVNPVKGHKTLTDKAVIHYAKKGAHVVPTANELQKQDVPQLKQTAKKIAMERYSMPDFYTQYQNKPFTLEQKEHMIDSLLAGEQTKTSLIKDIKSMEKKILKSRGEIK